MVFGKGYTDRFLTEREVHDLMAEALAQANLDGKRVLVIIPDHTRTAPIPLFFRLFHDLLAERVAALDYLVALGTHQPMSEEALNRLVGVTAAERAEKYRKVRILNHRWDLPETFVTLGTITGHETRNTSQGLLSQAAPVTINKLIFDYNQLIICGPTFPHEVASFPTKVCRFSSPTGCSVSWLGEATEFSIRFVKQRNGNYLEVICEKDRTWVLPCL